MRPLARLFRRAAGRAPRSPRGRAALAVAAAGLVGIAGGTGFRFDAAGAGRVAPGPPGDGSAGPARAATALTMTGEPRAAASVDAKSARAEAGRLRAERNRLQARIGGRVPRGPYIVVDRGENRLYLRRGDDIRLTAVVSTGSGAVLREAAGQRRTWVFETPTGRFSVLGKRTNPVWVRPDWAFLEEGKAPPASTRERYEYGALGEYALELGDGYLIHGTLYERLLGRSVTHGCVRVGRDDLRVLARAAGTGTPVFIF